MEIKTEDDSNDITDGKPSAGMFGISSTSLSAF